MHTNQKLADQLIRHEGLRLKPYFCTAGKLTIGVGRNLEGRGITEQEAYMLLNNDIAECLADLKAVFHKFDQFSEPVQRTLADMRFNLGHAGFRQFQHMIAAVQARDFKTAAQEMKNSRWYGQVGIRAQHLTQTMQDAATL